MNTVREQTKTKQRGTQNNVNSKADTDTVTTFDYKITKGQVRAVLKLIESGYSKRAACKKVGVHRSTFDSAVTRMSAADQYARATATLAEAQIEQMEKTIEDLRNGTITSDMARVELDARKWFASKLLPKKYGDKVEHEGNVNVVFH
jgi:transposase